MKKMYPPIPYEIFLSELYVDLKDYYHPEHKKTPIFRIYTEVLDYIIKHIEEYSNNKIKIDLDKSRLVNYNISLEKPQIILYSPIVPESLYPPYFHPNWKTYISEGIQSYLFDTPMLGIAEYFSKSDLKYLKDSAKDGNSQEATSENVDIPERSIIKKIFKWIKNA